MSGKSLAGLIEGFLEADGFTVERRAAHCFAAHRQDADGTGEQRFVWFVDPDYAISPDQASLLEDFSAAKDAFSEHALGFFVVPSLQGLTTAFRQQAKAAGVGIRVPVQFFDTAYKINDEDAGFGEGGGGEASELFRAVEREGRALAATRVPQPFEALSGPGTGAAGSRDFSSGGDLLAHLQAEMSEPADGPRLTIVLGNAGAGKSVLFTSLFSALHARFMSEKRHQRQVNRPILFLPEHIRDHQVASLDQLLTAVAATEAAAATRPSLMRFLNTQGFTTWMFDGLDEFFAGETDFAAALEAALAPGSSAQILICTRDSLLTSSTALRELVDRHMEDGRVRLYELARWGRPEQRALAWVQLTGALPSSGGAEDPAEVRGFLDVLDGSPVAEELATLPYYCDLMLRLAGLGEEAPKDELDLVAAAVDGLVDRELTKVEGGELGFRWDVFAGADSFVGMTELVEAWGTETFNVARDRERLLAVLESIGRERLMELIEVIAHQMRMTVAYPNESKGLATEDIEDLANFYLDVGLMPDLEPRVLLALVQFAFFGPGEAQGEVRFAHEIVADFLAGRAAMRIMRTAPRFPDAVSQALGVRHDLDRSIFLRYVARELAADPDLAEIVRAHLEAGNIRERSRMAAQHLLAEMNGRGL